MPVDTNEVLMRKIVDDAAFIVSETDNIADAATFNVHIKNPSGSGRTLWCTNITTSSDASYRAEIYDGFSSAPSGGSATEIQSLLLDSDDVDNNGVATANTNVTFTADSSHAIGIHGGGSGEASVGGVVSHPTLAIQPGREIVIEVTNISGTTQDYAIGVTYYESP